MKHCCDLTVYIQLIVGGLIVAEEIEIECSVTYSYRRGKARNVQQPRRRSRNRHQRH